MPTFQWPGAGDVPAFGDIAQYSDFVDEVTHIQDGEPTLLSVATSCPSGEADE